MAKKKDPLIEYTLHLNSRSKDQAEQMLAELRITCEVSTTSLKTDGTSTVALGRDKRKAFRRWTINNGVRIERLQPIDQIYRRKKHGPGNRLPESAMA